MFLYISACYDDPCCVVYYINDMSMKKLNICNWLQFPASRGCRVPSVLVSNLDKNERVVSGRESVPKKNADLMIHSGDP